MAARKAAGSSPLRPPRAGSAFPRRFALAEGPESDKSMKNNNLHTNDTGSLGKDTG